MGIGFISDPKQCALLVSHQRTLVRVLVRMASGLSVGCLARKQYVRAYQLPQ